jgi:alpha-L-fucosidase 2
MMQEPQERAKRRYEIWSPEPAPNGGGDWEIEKAGGRPYDRDWESWSYPIGNGYGGACIFGGITTERIQITDKTLHNSGCYNTGGLTGFAELYLDFNHGCCEPNCDRIFCRIVLVGF